MLRRTLPTISSSEITPESTYLTRMTRRGLLRAGAAALGAGALAACGADAPPPTASSDAQTAGPIRPTPDPRTPTASRQQDELGGALTPYASVTGYNNFYEFSTQKEAVATLARDFNPSPWTVTVGGLVSNPRTYDIDDLRKFDQEERIYRLRCVEAWSMVIPWLGFPLARLLREAGPTSQAKYVRFESLNDPKRFPGQRDRLYQWPYVEGLRLDEAMNDLTLLATGVYGRSLPPQSGAPLRLVVPWKYGFKSIKSIVRIDLVDAPPTSLWMAANGREYGFYANVNPAVPHPRWLQDSERRIGELARRKTLLFNGYEAQVASLYAGMDLARNY